MQGVGTAKLPKAGEELKRFSTAHRYCGDLSFYHWKYTWFIFYTKARAQLPTNGVIKEMLLFAAFLLWFCSAHCFFSTLWQTHLVAGLHRGLTVPEKCHFERSYFVFRENGLTHWFLNYVWKAQGRFVYWIHFLLQYRYRRSFFLSLTTMKQFT